MRQLLLILFMFVCVLVAVRRPFFGALAILLSAVLRDMLIAETYVLFFRYHCPEILYAATIIGVFTSRAGRLDEFLPRSMLDWGMVGFLLALIFSALANGVQIADHKYIDLFFKAVVLYFLLSRLADTPVRVSIVAAAVVASTMYLAVEAWLKCRAGDVYFARPYLFSSYHDFGLQLCITLPLLGALVGARQIHRAWAIVAIGVIPLVLAHKTLAPAALVGALVLYAAVRKPSMHWLFRIYLILYIPLFVLVGMRSQSRSTYLGLGFGLFMLAWYYRKRWYLQLLAVPLVAYAFLHNPERVLLRLESIWTHKTAEGTEDISIMQRIEQFHTAMRVIRAHPLLGVGPRQFFLHYDEFAGEAFRGVTYTMHNVPLLILCEEGLIGFAIYYGFMVLGCLRDVVFVVRRARGHPALEMLAPAAAGALMGFLAFLAYGLGQPQMWVVNIYATVALVSAAKRTSDAVLAQEAEDSRTTGETQVEFMPSGAATEVVFS